MARRPGVLLVAAAVAVPADAIRLRGARYSPKMRFAFSARMARIWASGKRALFANAPFVS